MKAHPSDFASGLLACATWLLAAVPARADDLGYAARRSWTIEEGLPQNSVRALAQAPDGALWIGTFGGLVRFDGRTFQSFTAATAPEVRSHFIVSLLVTRDGSLWIGTGEGRIARYDAGVFREFGYDDGVPGGVLAGLAQKPDGTLLVGGRGGIRRFVAGRFVDVSLPGSERILNVQQIHVTSSGDVLVAAGSGLFRLERERVSRLECADGHTYTAASFVGTSDSLGTWAKLDTGLASVDGDSLRISRGPDDPRLWRIFSSTTLRDGTTLVAASHGLFRITRQDRDLRAEAVELGLPGPSAVFTDREGGLWIGHLARGLVHALPKANRLIGFDRLGLARGNLLLQPKQHETVWIASTDGFEIGTFDAASDEYQKDAALSSGLGRVHGLLTTRANGLWIHHARGVRIAAGPNSVDVPCSVPAYASAMAEDGSGNVWIGGLNALARFDPAGRSRSFTTADGLPTQFEVSSLAGTPDGAVWIGTGDGVLRLANDRFRLLSHAEGVPGGALRAMFVDRGALWLGSYGGGLARWKDGRISHVDSSLGLYSDAISCMLGDGQGNLWLNSNRGAFRLRLADLAGLADGGSEPLACIAARSPESGGRGGTVTGKGTILFATTDGLGRIDPARVSAAAVAPGIELKSCIVDDVGHDVRSDVRVAPGRRELVFRFDGLSLSEPAAVHYRYRLIGLDPGWREGGNAGIARYTSVPPGEYRFEVLARSYDGVWSAQPAAVDLTLEPFVHERWWFKFTVAGIVIGLVCCAFFARSRAARRRQRALQHEVDLRTKAEDSLRKLTGELIRAQEDERRRVALELHDDLGQRLALLGVSLDVLARERTPTATNMRALADSVRSLSSDVHGLSHRLHSTKLDKLGLRAALELLCQELSDRHEIVIVFESKVEGLRVAREIELTLYRITQEALNNVLHHSDATSARVVLDPAGEALRLTVEDDGAGFDPEDGAKGGGIGLQGMRERTYLVGGNLTVVSAPGEGTRIVVTVPAQLPETETQREGMS